MRSHRRLGSLKPAETTLMSWGFSRILAVSSMPPMSMAPTALPISCSATRIGTAIFRMIASVVGRTVRVEQASFHHHRSSAARVSRDLLFFVSRFLYADREPGAGGWGGCAERARKAANFSR